MTDRTARISPAGAVVFLTESELRKAGIDPENRRFRYAVGSGEIVLEPVGDD